MSRPGRNLYIADHHAINGNGNADFTFTIPAEGMVLRSFDFQLDHVPFHADTAVPIVVSDVKRQFAGENQQTSMGTGDIPLQMLARDGDLLKILHYEEPIKGSSKIILKVVNNDVGAHTVWIVLWGAPANEDPYFVKPEEWPKVTPFQVGELDRSETQ